MNILAAIEKSAETGRAVTVEGMDALNDARGLIDNELAWLSVSADGGAILSGEDPEDRPFTIVLCDVYAHELEER